MAHTVVGAGVGAGIGSVDGNGVGRVVGSGDGSDVGRDVGAAVGENVATTKPRTDTSDMPRRRRLSAPAALATIELSKVPSEIADESRSFTCASTLASASSISTARRIESSVAIETSGVAPSEPALSQRCSSNDACGSVPLSAEL